VETTPRLRLPSERASCSPQLLQRHFEAHAHVTLSTINTTTVRIQQLEKMADIKAIKDQIWYIKRDIQNEEKKRDEWATTVSEYLPPIIAFN
jgi:hypothetical protein